MESSFKLRARGDGTLAITQIVASLDHGDESDITSFITDHANEPAITGGVADWFSDGIVVLTLDDANDQRQPVMQGFLYLSLLSGRFSVPPEVQALIFTPPPGP